MTAGRPHPLRSILLALLVLTLDAALLALGLGGTPALAREPRALALLVVWGVAGVTLALLRPVRGHDAVESQRDPGAMLALFFLPLLTPFVSALGASHGWLTLPAATAVSWAGVALVATGLAVRIAAMAQLGPRFSPVVAVQREHALETRGLYARVRHPGYLGALLACLGAALAFGNALALPLPALMLVAQLARIRREETLLSRHFGDAWVRYREHTGALLPRFGRARALH